MRKSGEFPRSQDFNSYQKGGSLAWLEDPTGRVPSPSLLASRSLARSLLLCDEIMTLTDAEKTSRTARARNETQKRKDDPTPSSHCNHDSGRVAAGICIFNYLTPPKTHFRFWRHCLYPYPGLLLVDSEEHMLCRKDNR